MYVQPVINARKTKGVALLAACLLVSIICTNQRVYLFAKYCFILVKFNQLRTYFTVYKKIR